MRSITLRSFARELLMQCDLARLHNDAPFPRRFARDAVVVVLASVRGVVLGPLRAERRSAVCALLRIHLVGHSDLVVQMQRGRGDAETDEDSSVVVVVVERRRDGGGRRARERKGTPRARVRGVEIARLLACCLHHRFAACCFPVVLAFEASSRDKI